MEKGFVMFSQLAPSEKYCSNSSLSDARWPAIFSEKEHFIYKDDKHLNIPS